MEEQKQEGYSDQVFKLNSKALPVVADSIDNVGKSTSVYLKRHLGWVCTVIGAAVLCEFLLFFNGVSYPVAYYVPIVVLFLWYSKIKNNIQHEFMQQFALDNNFEYYPKGELDGLDGCVFNIGHSKSVKDVVDGKYGESDITLMTYKYVTGEGKNAQTHSYTIFELRFDVAMPDILLQARGQSFEMPLFGAGTLGKILKLEGDFNNYFIFTPDVMGELIDKARNYSLEIVNGHLFIYDSKIVGTKNELYALYDLVQYFVEKLGPVLAEMKTTLVDMAELRDKK